MAASQNNLSLVINQQDSSGVNIINRQVGAIAYGGIAGEFDKRTLAADTNSHALDLPVATVLQFFFKNTHTSANITLTGTKSGGASQTLCVVPPGGVFVYWSPLSTGTGVGFTALNYQSDVASASAEMFLGG